MIHKLLGVADLITAAAFLINNWFDKTPANWFPNNIVLFLAIYLLIKGLFFLITLDFASAIDVISAIVIILSLHISIPIVLAAVIFIFLIQKAVLTLVV